MKRYFPYIVVLFLLVVSFYLGRTSLDNDVPIPNPIAPATCGVQECHGLDLTCGSDVPQACTAMYQLGDGCMQFFECETANGQCGPKENTKFAACKTCVEQCMVKANDLKDPSEVFSCESECVGK